ncbi:ABC transporter substrate-binding protein [Paracoccus caeni]|uniref:ABC transporter substrate-binding protein n=1 Tax=Paracoccus caeni TaxID=657651 RepID=A0A934SHP9_9RHOB|nr:ABC transporter substrate-binding protein [Paracoccus caeni]MBK4218052.1 ABC transporter substrate-binding protein [Paracoccus caeni]
MYRPAFVAAALLIAQPAFAESYPDAKRVLTIGGSVTEIAYALGQKDRVIARDSTSSYPPEVNDLPDVGYVRALSPEGVLSVNPDLILAEEGAGPPETMAVLQEAGIPIELIPAVSNSDELIAKIEAVADALGVPDTAGPTVEALQADLAKLSEATVDQDKKKVLFILSLQGGRILASGQGTEADAIIRLAGAENAVQGVDGYKPMSDEAITAAAPDAILLMNRGPASESTTRGPSTVSHDAADEELLSMAAISTTPAAATKTIIRMDGLYLLGFGPRTGQAALELHNAIYGDS